ncbi:MAG: hypothetical protein KatS3mg011_1184 [Acidimicrobiia bacterium]|nr:MAG: hypothetical protein KatS3mg011_1184 [Acidimicrobiia bacterium]
MSLQFHPLRVVEVTPLTDESVAVTFDVPDDLAETFSYLPGQHVTVRAFIDGEDVRRSYSICANANSGKLRIGIKRLPGGKFSTWATTQLRPGDLLDVMPPVGEFVIRPDPSRAAHYCAIAAGSGITPVLSLISTTLESEPNSSWTLVFGNRSVSSIMFLEELEGLKDRYCDRLQIFHVLSRERPEIPLLAGRIDEEKLHRFLDLLIPPTDEWFLCGPYGLVQTARKVITARGIDPSRIHDELFFAGPVELPAPPREEEGPITVRFTLDGRTSEVKMHPEEHILDAALRVRRELPFSCKGGMCATCKARLVEGEVDMDRNYALVEEELAAGFILTCQAKPLTEQVVVDYDVTGGRG